MAFKIFYRSRLLDAWIGRMQDSKAESRIEIYKEQNKIRDEGSDGESFETGNPLKIPIRGVLLES
jgi:hypothetical protein